MGEWSLWVSSMKEVVVDISEENTLKRIADAWAVLLQPGSIFYLKGPLGVGKTTFVRALLRSIGYKEKVKSPTYTLVESYEWKGEPFYHFDLYRLGEQEELDNMGVRDYFSSRALIFIEWPEQGKGFLQPPEVTCEMSFAPQGRKIRFIAHTPRAEQWLLSIPKE